MKYPTIEEAIGKTPLVSLQRIHASENAKRGNVILGKLEGNNPAGSVKDRPALSMIQRAQERGEIKPGDTLIEATSGNTGIALAMAAAIKGYRMVLIMPEDLSIERAQTMKWTLDTTYNLVLQDSAAVDHKYMQFWSLSPLESFKQLFVINEPPSSGRAFQIKYQPHVCTAYFKYAFRWHNEEGSPIDISIDGDQRFAYQGPMYSDVCQVFAESNTFFALDPKSKKYYNAKWGAVKGQLKRHKSYTAAWPILNTQLYSQAVLSSLPTYSHTYVILETKNGIAYLSLGYQIGKIYPFRSFLAKIAHLCGARRVFWQTSSSRKVMLQTFKPYAYQLEITLP